jgi:4a-hydroxytetrahydrobiopterin dehydratase
MSTDVTKLTDDEVQKHLQTVPLWTLNSGELQRIFELPSFPSAIFFVDAIAHLAELGAHHPDIFIAYSRVRLNFVTHSAGGITQKDFVMAKKVNALWDAFAWKSSI